MIKLSVGANIMTNYSSNLTDLEWDLIEPFVKPSNRGRPRKISSREVLNAIFYVAKTGCQWRLLPHDFPNWHTVYDYYRDWKLNKTWDKIHDIFRTKLRENEEKKI